MNKRTFLKQLGIAGMVGPSLFKNIDRWIQQIEHLPPEIIAQDEDFWEKIRRGYQLKPEYINLENGYYCMMPLETLHHFMDKVQQVNYHASYYMRTEQWNNKKDQAKRLAQLLDCSAEELIITRNTTESLDTIIGGIHWEAGDEAVMAEQDYGAMLNMFKLQERRHGIVNKIISLPNHPQSDEEIVNLYADAIGPKTKLLMVCHLVNITGQILPIRKICDMAHRKGVEVMVDGAHAFAHFEFSIQDLDCDYYGSSLHKWLSTPLGAGLLYVKKGKAKNVWPLFAERPIEANNIYKLNHTGTHPVHTDLAIGHAIDYYLKIGPARKEARLRYLQRYWTDQVRHLDHIVLNTPAEAHRSCAIANVGVKGMKSLDLAKTLMEKYKIWTVAIERSGVSGCRITPNIYTSTKELDQFVAALKALGT